MNLGTEVRKQLAEVPVVKVVTGDYIGAEGSQVIVSIGDASALMPLHSAAWPMPGERVRCVNLADHWICLGPELPRQQWGEVVSVGGGKAVVEYPPGSGVTASMLVPRGDTALVGDFALLDWANGGVIVRLYGDEPAAPVVEPAAPASEPVTRTFRAVDAGTFDGNGRYIDAALYARSTPQGVAAWFYGTAIRDAVGSRQVIGGRIRIPIRSVGGGDILLGYHTLLSRQPNRVPDLQAGSIEDPQGGWHPLPLAIAQGLAGAGRGVSLRTNSGGAPSYKSLASDPLSGEVELTYR